jgi:hypothetical protein
MAPQRQENALLPLPHVAQFVDQQPLQESRSREIV